MFWLRNAIDEAAWWPRGYCSSFCFWVAGSSVESGLIMWDLPVGPITSGSQLIMSLVRCSTDLSTPTSTMVRNSLYVFTRIALQVRSWKQCCERFTKKIL